MPAGNAAPLISIVRLVAAAGTCALLAAVWVAPSQRVALAWGPALDPPPPSRSTLPAAVDPAVAARLTADDLARGLAGLAALPASHPLVLRADQARTLLPALRRARAARTRALALHAALPAHRQQTRAAFAPLVVLLPEPSP